MKRPKNFRLSEESIRILGELSRRLGINQTAVIEFILHSYAEKILTKPDGREEPQWPQSNLTSTP